VTFLQIFEDIESKTIH